MVPISTGLTPPKAGKVAFQRGLICGLAQAVIASSVLLVNAFASPGIGVALLLSVISFLTGLAAYFLAGILGAKQTGKVSTGVFAGMWTGGVYGLIDFVLSLVIFLQVSYPKLIDSVSASGTVTNLEAYKTGAMIGGVGAEIFGVLFAVGLGAGFGALGGLIGRNTSPWKQQQIPVMPVYAAYPGQPVYPALVPPMSYSQQPAAEQVYVEQPVANPSQPPQPSQPIVNPYQEQ